MAKRAPAEELRELASTWREVLSGAGSPSERDGIRGRIIRPFIESLRGAHETASRHEQFDALLALHDIESLGREILENIAEIADERADLEMQKRVLDKLLAEQEGDDRLRTLEKLGDVLQELGDRSGAVDKWAAAARGHRNKGNGTTTAQRLFERVLDAAPKNEEAASQLVEMHLGAGAWERVPEVVASVLRADVDRGGELLLGLENRAMDAGETAYAPFVSMVDEAVALGLSTSELTRRLRRAGARTLAKQESRHDDASASFRVLLDAFESADDAREYESFIQSRSDEAARHLDRRWLFSWRVARADKREQAAELLRAWAKAEEERGEIAEAVTVQEQLLDALPEGHRAGVRVALAKHLVDLGRFEDAAAALAPNLVLDPPDTATLEALNRLFSDETARSRVIEKLESLSASDDQTAAHILDVLLTARDATAAMPDARRRWYRRATGIAPASPPLAVALADARATPDDVAIWETAERVARRDGTLETVLAAYGDALAGDDVDASMAELLGRRLVALESECTVDVSALLTWLERVLERSPGTRFALDRFKVAVGALGDWDRLFEAYDKAIEGVTDEAKQGELLDEAMFVARDLADDAVRATKYLSVIHARRPDDLAIMSALERLYERQGNKTELVALLRERLLRSERSTRRGIYRRIIALLLDIGKVDDATRDLRSLVLEDDSVADVVDLLERLVEHAPDTFSERLRDHYEEVGRLDDALRVAKAGLAQTTDPNRRSAHVRELLRLRIVAASSRPDPLARVATDLDVDAGNDVRLRRVARRALLMASIAKWKTDEGDARAGAFAAIEALRNLRIETGDMRGAARILLRGSRLRFDNAQKRLLLDEAAGLYAEKLNDRKKAIRIYGDVFREGVPDNIADSTFDRYAALLESADEPAKLARLWEGRAARESRRSDREAEAMFWVRAAKCWEAPGGDDPRRALEAYRHAAELEAVEGHEGLARLHSTNWRWREAIESLTWLLERSPKDRAKRAVELANAYVETGAQDQARALLRDTLTKLEDAADARVVRSRLLDLLRRGEAWAELADALEQQGQRVEGRERVTLLAEAADVRLSKENDRTNAIRLLELAVAADPSDATLRPKLAELLEANESWEAVAAVLAAQVELEADRAPREAAALRQRVARAYLRLERKDDALVHLRTAAKLQPTDGRIGLELARVAFEAGDLDSAERAYRTLLLSSQGGLVSRLTVYVALAEIAAKRGDEERASNLLESALDAAIDGNEDLAAVEEAIRSVKRWDLLVRALEHRIARAPDATAKADAVKDLAEAWRSHLGRPSDLGVRIRRLADEIAQGLEKEGAAAAAGGAWPSLWSAYAALGDEETLLTIVRRRVEAMKRGELDRNQWRPWLLEAASLCARLGEVDLAVRLHAVLLEDAPNDHEVWASLRTMLDKSGDRARLVPFLQRAIEAMEAGADRSKLRVELASLLDGDAATEQLTQAASDDPMNDEAASRLATTLEREGRFDALAAALRPRLDALTWGDPRWLDTAWRLGRALESANRFDDAARLYESILDRNPTDRDTAKKLAHRLEAIESDRLGDALEHWMRVDETVARAVAPRLVELREAKGDRVALTRALEAALKSDPGDAKLLERFIAVHEESGDPVAVANALRRAWEASPEDLRLLRRLVESQRALGEEKENLRILDEVISKRSDAALLCLRATVKEALGDDDGAVADLSAMGHSDSELTNERIEIVRRILSWKTPPIADELAMMLVDDLVLTGKSSDVDSELRAVLDRTPEHSGALFRFGALYVARKDWPNAKDTYAKLLAVVERTNKDDPEKIARVAVAYGRACVRADQAGEARAALERVLRIAPNESEVGETLEHVCDAMKDWKRLAELVIARAERTESTSEKASLLIDAAKLLTDAGDKAGALRTTEAARALDPGNADVALACAEAYLANGSRAHHAIVVLSEAVERNQRKRVPAMASVYFVLAKAHLALDELVEALDALKSGFAIDVRTAELAMLLGQVAFDLDDVKTAERAFVAVTFASRMEASGGDVTGATKATALFHLATLAHLRGDLVTARRWANKAVTEDSSHEAARALVDELEQNAQAHTPRTPNVRA